MKLLYKLEKYEFYKEKVEFLGYIVTPGGLLIDLTKVNIILKRAIFLSVKEIQSFLGFANFYRQFIKGYLVITIPLIELIKKDKEFI